MWGKQEKVIPGCALNHKILHCYIQTRYFNLNKMLQIAWFFGGSPVSDLSFFLWNFNSEPIEFLDNVCLISFKFSLTQGTPSLNWVYMKYPFQLLDIVLVFYPFHLVCVSADAFSMEPKLFTFWLPIDNC